MPIEKQIFPPPARHCCSERKRDSQAEGSEDIRGCVSLFSFGVSVCETFFFRCTARKVSNDTGPHSNPEWLISTGFNRESLICGFILGCNLFARTNRGAFRRNGRLLIFIQIAWSYSVAWGFWVYPGLPK